MRIFGGPDIYVREHSSLQLECVISATIVSPKFVVWEHNGQLVPGTSLPLCSHTTYLGLTMVALMTHSNWRELNSLT